MTRFRRRFSLPVCALAAHLTMGCQTGFGSMADQPETPTRAAEPTAAEIAARNAADASATSQKALDEAELLAGRVQRIEENLGLLQIAFSRLAEAPGPDGTPRIMETGTISLRGQQDGAPAPVPAETGGTETATPFESAPLASAPLASGPLELAPREPLPVPNFNKPADMLDPDVARAQPDPEPVPQPARLTETEPRDDQASDSSGVFGLHLTSYRDAAQAQQGWQVLAARYDILLSDLRPYMGDVTLPERGRFTRLIAGGFPTEKTAKARCDALLAAGADHCAVMRRPDAPLPGY